MDWGTVFAIAGAAIAVGLSGAGSSIGVSYAGRASSGVMAKEPEKFGNLLILTALPGTQGIYGFVAAFFVMIKIDLLGETIVTLTSAQGMAIFFACLPMAIAGLFSGVMQGKVSAAGVAVVVSQPADSMKAVIMSVLVETYAVLGLLITIMLIIGIKVG